MKHLKGLSAAAFVFFFLAHGQAQNFLTNGLVAYYAFDGNVNDESGNGHNGTNYGAAFVQNRFDVPNAAIHFNQSEVLTGFFPPLGSAPRTFSGWFQAAASSSKMTLMAYGGPGAYAGDRFELVLWNTGQFFVDCSSGAVWTPASFTDSQWHSFAVVVPQNAALSNIVIYIDGILETNLISNAPGNIINTAATYPLQFGKLYFLGDSRPLTGSLSDVRVYNRALSDAEVRQLYQYEVTPPPSFLTNGLTAYYPFEWNAIDASGNGNNGTAYNGVTYVPHLSGFAAEFAGNPQYISLPASISNYEDLTVTFWIKTSASNPNSWNTSIFLVSRDIPNANYDWNILLGAGRKIQFHTGTPTNDNLVLVSASDVSSNEWAHVACVADSRGAIKEIFINGLENASTAWDPKPFVNNGVPIAVGASSVGPQLHLYFVGDIDDLRFYDRALSAAEIQQLYLIDSVCIPHSATATAEVVNGFVVGATITDGGCGYTNAPLVLFEGGGGTGAAAVAVVSNGVVAEIIITDAGIGYTSTPSILIGSAPSIAVQPQSVTINLHDSASFEVVPGNFTPVNYQWSLNGTNIAGATAASLTISNVTQSLLGSYSVLLTNGFGWTNSSPAILSMYPYLAVQFTGVLVYWGQDTTLSVQAGGSGPLTYQWYQNGVPVPNGTNAQLVLSGIQFTNAGLYSVVVNNPFGSVTNAPAQVVVNPAGVSLGLYPGVTISGTVGYNYVIQRTPDLTNTNSWVTLTNLTLAQPVQIWVDTSMDASRPSNPHYFYRVLPGQ